MKNLFLLVFALSFSAIFGQQKLEGTYTGSTLIEIVGYTFSKDGTFYINPECGKGHYSIKNDTLILNYDSAKYQPVPYHITHEIITYTDSNILKIKVFDKDKNPCHRCLVDVYKELYAITNSSLIDNGVDLTDKNGEVIFKIPKNSFGCGEIRVLKQDIEGTLAGESYQFPFDMRNSYDIEVFLTGIQDYERCLPVKYSIVKRKIKKLNKDELVLEGGKFDLILRKEKTK
ncbi:hypothetical protein [Ornithobacterium rhinotracheale]|uniref:hypothetical protein n=1 Tax=Ornithobacterium rhinotracheale TaxID=28251 RepID=UPI0040370FF2